MSEPTTFAIKKYVLPFSVLSENRKDPFTVDLEAAAVFSLAELDRAKGGGLIMKQTEEKTEFIVKVGYPLWLFTGTKTVLVFDGFNRSNYTLPYIAVPDVKAFVDNLRRGSKTRETHLAFLRDNINYFQAVTAEKGLLVSALIKSPEFLEEFDSYRHEAKEAEYQDTSVGLLTPTIDESLISSEIHELDMLYSSFQEDVEGLCRCMKFLNRVTHHYVRELRGKARMVREEFDAKIREEEEHVAPKVDQLKDDYDIQMTDLAKNFERQRLPVQKEKVKLEKARDHALERIERYKLEAKTHAENGDSAGEQKWKEKGNQTKKEVSEIENQLKQTEKALKDLEERRSLEIFKLRDELEGKVKEARKNLLELEASRDAKVLILKQEMDKLEKQTKLISDQIGRTVKQREADIAQFEKLGVRKELGLEGNALHYVPFYVICYQAELRRRYLILPPSVANAIGFATKLKGVLGMARIKQLMVPRFKIITSLMDTIQVLIQQSAVFETEIKELGARTNLLTPSAARAEIEKGLAYLKNEGWLSEKEYDAIRQRLA
jgi:hypothetical protein